MSDEVTDTALKTKEAVSKIIEAKLHGAKPTTINTGDRSDPAYVRYTPTNVLDASSDGSGADKQRIIKIVDKKVDPMLPPSFKIRKTPQLPSETEPAPILHEQSTAKLTAEDQKKWYIPPAISNWKNTNGFTISIDKRLAGVGKDEDANIISDNFGSLSSALENASKQAKEELKLRAKLKKKLDKQQVLENQQRLSKIAQEARSGNKTKGSRWDDDNDDDEDPEKLKAASSRERARAERRRKTERELKMGSMSTERKIKMLARDQGRDISERVALGISKATDAEANKPKMETRYDSRLFLNAAGANARHSKDQVYDTPLFAAQEAFNDIYRARASGSGMEGKDDSDTIDDQMKKFGNEERFDNLSHKFKGGKSESKLASTGPVMFEKDTGNNSFVKSEEGHYGLDDRDAKRRRKD